MNIEFIFITVSVLLLICILSNRFARHLGIPAALVFLTIGMLAGSDGIGGIHFDNYHQVHFIGILSLSLILFSGGIDTDYAGIKQVFYSGLSLATLGVVISSVLVGIFSVQFLNIPFLDALLLGAIISSTDSAAIFPILRGGNINLKERIVSLLELESGSNDPMSVFLTVGIIQLKIMQATTGDFSLISLVPMFFQEMLIGTILGISFGRSIVFILNHAKIEYIGLYPVMTVAMVLLIFGLTQMVHGNGFLAVYLAGLELSRRNFLHRKSLILFHDGIAWLMQILMFLALGLFVFPKTLPQISYAGILISLFLIFVARPLSVFISLSFSPFSWREKAVVSWMGLRGAAPIILATFPYLYKLENASVIFNTVFFVVLFSVLLQGTTVSFVIKLFRVNANSRRKVRFPLAYRPSSNIRDDILEVEIPQGAKIQGKSVLNLNLPLEIILLVIRREERAIIPRGTTIIEDGDIVYLLVDPKYREDVLKKLTSF